MTAPEPATCYRFGVFELDLATGELRRKGMRVRLHAQPAEILRLLLERQGQMLTREQIREALWPGGTFVDFDHGVNSAINRLREALGDDAKRPRFVETVARRGYRFVAPVELVRPPEPAPPQLKTPLLPEAEAERPAAQPEPRGSVPRSSVPRSPEPEKSRRRWLATREDLPASSPALARTLFVLLQLMYAAFYVGSLANLPEIAELLAMISHGTVAMGLLVGTAALLLPVRMFLLCAVLFRAPRLLSLYLAIWPFLLPLDLVWALAPFLLLHHISFGLALASMALLVFAPFAQRSLMLMATAESSA